MLMQIDVAQFQVMILAGGRGTRLASVLQDLPKPMAPINGRPFLEYQLKDLHAQGFRRVQLLTGHMAEKISAYFADGKSLGLEITYSIETEPLGTGGAVAKAFRNSQSTEALVMNGDTLFLTDFQKFLRQSRAPVTLAIREEADISRYGSVTRNAAGEITSFKEKSAQREPGLISAGFYYLQKEYFLRHQPAAGFSIEKDFFEKTLATEHLYSVLCQGEFLDIGLPETLRLAQSKFPDWTKRSP